MLTQRRNVGYNTKRPRAPQAAGKDNLAMPAPKRPKTATAKTKPAGKPKKSAKKKKGTAQKKSKKKKRTTTKGKKIVVVSDDETDTEDSESSSGEETPSPGSETGG
jgi:hypothetical protein